jgi:hypothetical protein
LGDPKDLEAALKYNFEAIDLIPADHPNRPRHLQNLAMSFSYRYQQFEDLKDLEQVNNFYAASFATSALNDPESSWSAALAWASFSKRNQPAYEPTTYRAAFHLLPEILWMGNTIPVRHDTIHRLGIGLVTSMATRACINLGQLRSAVEIMEQGLGITFQQMLQLKPDVDKLSPQQAADLEQLSMELYRPTTINPIKAAAGRKYLLDHIQKQPGLEYFLLPKPYSVLCHAAHNGPIIILNSHADSCDGIIILNPTSEPVHVSLLSVKHEQLQSQREMLKELLSRCNVRTRRESRSTRLFGQREGCTTKTSQECFDEILNWLWKNVVEPVYHVLKAVSVE